MMDKYDKALKDFETALFEEYKKIPPHFSDHKNRYKNDLQTRSSSLSSNY